MSRLDEKRFTALGVEWIARFNFNATCAIEDETGESFYTVAAPFLQQMDKDDAADPAKVLAMLGGRHNSTIRLLLFHALGHHHEVTKAEVGDIIDELGLQGAMEIVLWAIGRALGAQPEGAEGNAKPIPTSNRKPPKAAASNG